MENNNMKKTVIILSALSLTWLVAHKSKQNKEARERAKGIKRRNFFYATVSFALLIIFHFLGNGFKNDPISYWPVAFLALIAWYRCNEITISFFKDALDKSAGRASKSSLLNEQRIRLSATSYFELINNFAFIYFTIPSSWFKNDAITSPFDAWYFSGVTITTLGYGDISPIYWMPKFLVIQEVLAGFTLLIVSFAFYTSKKNN